MNIIGGSRVTDAALSARIATGLGAAQVRNGVVGGHQPFNNLPPLNTYPSGPLNRDTTGNFLVTGQVGDAVAAHTASDIPCSAQGPGACLFTGAGQHGPLLQGHAGGDPGRAAHRGHHQRQVRDG